jgi:hypothetical protein
MSVITPLLRCRDYEDQFRQTRRADRVSAVGVVKADRQRVRVDEPASAVQKRRVDESDVPTER